MTRNEAERLTRQNDTLRALGFTQDEAEALRRISMTLHRWHERECGDSNDYATYGVERDEQTGKPFMVHHGHNGKSSRWPVADRETGAKKRLAAILKGRNGRVWREAGFSTPTTPEEATLEAYIQTDPRGAALYILRPGDVPQGEDPAAYYSRGICVY